MGSAAAAAASVTALAILGLLIKYKRRAPRLKVLLAIVAGAGLAGPAGALLTEMINAATNAVGTATAAAFGVAAPAVLAIAVVMIVYFDIKDDKKADPPALVAAFTLLPLLAAQSGLLGQLGDGLAGGVSTSASELLQMLGGG